MAKIDQRHVNYVPRAVVPNERREPHKGQFKNSSWGNRVVKAQMPAWYYPTLYSSTFYQCISAPKSTLNIKRAI